MKDNEKSVALIRLRDMIYFGVQPTVRQCGLPPETIQELAKERLVLLRDRKFGDDLDRFFPPVMTSLRNNACCASNSDASS
jgi:hypothetical protein